MRRNYAVLTKWVVAATFPLFLTIFLFPEAVLDVVFGASYVQAGTALRILALGALIHVLVGPNASTLVVIGKTRLNMIDDLIGATVNVLLNLFLIPAMGIIGAAIASAVSLGMINVLKSAQIFRMHKIHPFTKNYLKPMILSTVVIFVIYSLVNPVHSVWVLISLFFLFMAIYGVSLIITRSLDEEDIMMFLKLEKLTGIDASYVKRILKRFM